MMSKITSIQLPRWLRRRFQLEIAYLLSISLVTVTGLILRAVGKDVSSTGAVLDSIVIFSLLFLIGLVLRMQQKQADLMPCEVITDPGELYDHFLFEVGRSTNTILLSHVRLMAFSRLEANKDFQDAVAKWASDDRNQRVLRIVGISETNTESNEVAARLAADANEYGGLHLRGLKWNQTTPMTNFAIFDERVAFVCFYDGRDEFDNRAALWALRITDPPTVSRLGRYFLSLWEDPSLIREKEMIERFHH